MTQKEAEKSQELADFLEAVSILEKALEENPNVNRPEILAMLQQIELRHGELADLVHQAINPEQSPVSTQKREQPFDKSKDPTVSTLAKRFRSIQDGMPLPIGKFVSSELMALNAGQPSAKQEDRLRFLLNLPWGKLSELKTDLPAAKEALRESHFGMDKVKDTVIEHVSVSIHTGKPGGTIICLVGPPGTGKTSIIKAIAEANGRKFGKVALGGVRGDYSIRGHSYTFEGSQPGRILKAINAAGTMNPVIGLDEVDKVDGDATTDALLEVLDPEQNHAFQDHYIGCPVDLSNVLFVCTANSLEDIPQPLQDRMEIIDVEGYVREEKMEIARQYLVPKQLKDKNLTDDDIDISQAALRVIINEYTKEAGVRGLEKKIAKICSKAVQNKLEGQTDKQIIQADNLHAYLGTRRIPAEQIPDEDAVGQVNSLYCSQRGGGITPLSSVVASSLSKHFKIKATGQLGKVISESISKATAFIRSRAKELGLKPKKLNKKEIHIDMDSHVPTDGPSAGAVMTASIISTLLDIPIKRDVAMTGTISLNGQIGPIGGLKQKLDGALAAGVKTVLIPAGNEVDLADVPKSILDELEIRIVKSMDDVLPHLLTEWPKAKVEPKPTPAP